MTSTPVPYENMTSRGVIQMPTYVYPGHQRIKLCAAKQDVLTSPALVTMRAVDRDNVLQKLPDEHCRTSVGCRSVDYDNHASYTILGKVNSQRGFSCLNMPGFQEIIRENYSNPQPLRTNFNYGDFSSYIDSLRNSVSTRLPPLLNSIDRASTAHVSGYYPSLLAPDQKHAWRYTLRAVHEFDGAGRKPIPADVTTQFRDIYSKSAISGRPWRK